MPKKSKDRSADLADLGEDYDWIKSLGEGRATASSSASAAASAAPGSLDGSGRGARPALPAAPIRRQSHLAGDEVAAQTGSVPAARSAPERDSPRNRGRDGGRRRRGHDRGPDRQPASADAPESDDFSTDPGGYGSDLLGRGSGPGLGAAGPSGPGRDNRGREDYGLDDYGLGNYGLGDYGAIGAAALGQGGGSRGDRHGSPSDSPGGLGSGPAASGRSGDGGYGLPGSVLDVPAPRPGNGDSRTTPGRAVRLTVGRAVDLQANPADGLFNPAAEEYGQPLYAVPDRANDGRGRSGPDGGSGPPFPDDAYARQLDDTDSDWPGAVPAAAGRNRARTGRRGTPRRAEPESGTDTGEFGQPPYSLYDTGSHRPSGPSTGPQTIWPDDPFADTDAGSRARALPAGQPDSGRREPAGWPDFDNRSPTASWPETTARPGLADGQGPAPWADATGWPETDEEQGTASWSEPTGWPEITGETAFAPDADLAFGSGVAARIGPQPRIGDRATGSGAEADEATGQFDPDEASAVATGAPAAAPPAGPARRKQSGRRQAPAGRKADRKAGGRKRAGVRPEAAIANAVPQRTVGGAPGRPDDAEATSTGPLAPAATPAQPAPAKTKKGKAAKGRRRGRRRVLVLSAALIVAVLAVAAYVVLHPRTAHVVTAPPTLGSFTKQGGNTTAAQFKHRLMAAAGSDVKNVVAATYQRSSGPGDAKAVPQIMVFIGGNLAGNASASSLISAYMTQMQGSFSTSPGKLGGEAACAPGSGPGRPAECAWADGDTFGVVVSAALKPAALANEMRQMRPLVEHVSK